MSAGEVGVVEISRKEKGERCGRDVAHSFLDGDHAHCRDKPRHYNFLRSYYPY